MPYNDEQISTLLKNLPDDVKEAVSSVDTVDIITGVQKKHNLHIDQVGELSNEILLLTIGVTLPQKFIENLESRLKIQHETAKQIALEVNEKILRPIKESLMQIHKMKAAEEVPASESEIKEGVSAEEIPEAIRNPEERKIDVNFAEEKLSGGFSLPKKSGPDPYRETV
ncbi:MAG: hypothetical protein HYT94_03350 [Parcubacteria group bacterium]|nr:hypothetical protein [Parcubacteria group bacterium]